MSPVAEIAACRPYLMRIAMSRVHDSDRAEELVQDTLLAAIRGHTSFAGRSRFRTWITGILLHKVSDTLRAKARNLEVSVADAPAPMAFADEGDDFDAEGCWRAPVNAWTDPECALESKRFHVMFEAGLSKLPPQQLRAFQLREVVGMEADEVCREMDITSNNLCVLLHRARGQLRRYLDRDYFCAAA